jgi:predicted RNA-binding Zn-ribbon protein involved in translation (DUF1610 family)
VAATHRKSFTQRLVTGLLPWRAEEIERESREWLVICPNCGHERSIWELGGVRYGARSKGKRMRLECPACGRQGWHKVERRPRTQ